MLIYEGVDIKDNKLDNLKPYLTEQADKNPRFCIENSFGIELFNQYKQILINPIKELWKNKIVIVIEGFNSYFGVYNDLFDNVKSCLRLNKNPSYDAFKNIDKILSNALNIAKNYNKDEICFVVSLGASAKILCIYLIEYGYTAYDIGNCSISYDCIIHAKNRCLIDRLNTKQNYILFQ
ncbi:GT-D fold domain-containing glycosyltransferase [Helicobacter sp. MIT 14-3879]|uniref:GT-D fold domain-containing glycosyltransferase n=1 Tax=Helicobacter sp. MIT 14-3879 TaxID=2040649 RepID=UPI0015F1286A|nr:GT-D fold domain-containing glycosyltransferase [Helicobacter sp. MIT 14-3879]